jgi:hypothetical protein
VDLLADVSQDLIEARLEVRSKQQETAAQRHTTRSV